MDDFFNSGPLVEQLAEDKIFVAGTICTTVAGHTTFACSYCKVRLCKIPCFADFHKN